MLVYIRDGSAQANVRAATLRWKLQINLAISPSILTPGQPVPVQTLWCQAPGRVTTGVPSMSLGVNRPGKISSGDSGNRTVVLALINTNHKVNGCLVSRPERSLPCHSLGLKHTQAHTRTRVRTITCLSVCIDLYKYPQTQIARSY